MKTCRLTVTGRVQGVGYRFFAQRKASGLGLKGWVKNNMDGSVELSVQGDQDKIEILIKELQRGPMMSNVESISSHWLEEDSYDSFQIVGW